MEVLEASEEGVDTAGPGACVADRDLLDIDPDAKAPPDGGELDRTARPASCCVAQRNVEFGHHRGRECIHRVFAAKGQHRVES